MVWATADVTWMATDGVSKTMMVFEDAGREFHFILGRQQFSNSGTPAVVNRGKYWFDPYQYFVWANTQDDECGLTTVMNCTNWDEIYSFHSGGANCTFGDGSVHYLSETIDPETIISLITRAGGDVLQEEP